MLPCQFYAKTWVCWTQVIIFGYLALFSCIAGPLFWLDIAKSANGSPGYEAGIPLTIIGYGFMLPSFIFFVCRLLAFRKPMIVIFKEGLEIRNPVAFSPIQVPLPSQIAFFIIPLVVFWRLLTLQKLVDVTPYRISWSGLSAVYFTKAYLTINGQIFDRETVDNMSVSFDQNIFGRPEKIGKILEQYYLDPALQAELPSWDDKQRYDPKNFFSFL